MVHKLVPGEDRICEVMFDKLEKRKVCRCLWEAREGTYPPRPGDDKRSHKEKKNPLFSTRKYV